MSSCSLGWLFTLLLPLLCRSFAISCSHIYLVFALYPDLLGCFSEILCSYLYLKVFSSNNFRVSYLTLRPLIHSELIFLCRVKDTDQVSFFPQENIQVSQHNFFWRDCFFLNIYFWCLRQLSGRSRLHEYIFAASILSIDFHTLHLQAAYIFKVLHYDLRVLTFKAMFLLFRIVLTTWNLLWFYVNFKSLNVLLLWRTLL